MSNQTAKIDFNYEPTTIAVTDDVAFEISNLLVDPITGRLEIDVLAVGSLNDVVAEEPQEDPDYWGVAQAVTDDANQDIRLFKVDPTNGRLIIDFIIE